MTAKTQVHDKTEAPISQDSHFSYVFSSLVKAMQRVNQQNEAENGRKSFRKKVGSMVSNVFGKHNKFPESGSHGNDEAVTKLKNMTESLYIRSDTITVKSSEEKAEDGDHEGKAEPSLMMEGGSEKKEASKSWRTYSKYLRKRMGNVGNDESSDVRVDNNDGDGSGSRQWLKRKIGRSVKRGVSEMMGGKLKKQEEEEEEEVWRKRILRGGKCRPLNGSWVIHYDENGVLIPESP